MEKYFDVIKEWERKYNEPPSEKLKVVLLDWEDVVNTAYQDGYEAGIKESDTNAKTTRQRRGQHIQA